MPESRAVQFLVVAVAIVLSCADAFLPGEPWFMESLPLSTQTCHLGGVTLCSIILVLLVESKFQHKSGENLQTDELSKAAPIESQKRQWQYIDPEGKVHGPFSTVEMRQWYKAGYLSQNLMVSFGETNAFSPLHVLFTDQSLAFTSPPKVRSPSIDVANVCASEGGSDQDVGDTDSEHDEIRKWMERRRAHYCNKPTAIDSICEK